MWKPTGNPLVNTVARSAFVLNMPEKGRDEGGEEGEEGGVGERKR